MKQLLLSDSPADDLIQWAKKVEAMGDAISSLASHDAEVLERQGQYLGWIISDYADALKEVINEAYPAIQNFFKGEAGKIDAMGDAIGSLAFLDSEVLERQGQCLGWIVSDYAGNLKKIFNEAYPALQDFFKGKEESIPKDPSDPNQKRASTTPTSPVEALETTQGQAPGVTTG